MPYCLLSERRSCLNPPKRWHRGARPQRARPQSRCPLTLLDWTFAKTHITSSESSTARHSGCSPKCRRTTLTRSTQSRYLTIVRHCSNRLSVRKSSRKRLAADNWRNASFKPSTNSTWRRGYLKNGRGSLLYQSRQRTNGSGLSNWTSYVVLHSTYSLNICFDIYAKLANNGIRTFMCFQSHLGMLFSSRARHGQLVIHNTYSSSRSLGPQ